MRAQCSRKRKWHRDLHSARFLSYAASVRTLESSRQRIPAIAFTLHLPLSHRILATLDHGAPLPVTQRR